MKKNLRLVFLFPILMGFFASSISAQTIIHSESFETDGASTRYTLSQPHGNDGGYEDYFERSDAAGFAGFGMDMAIAGEDGSYFIGIEDMDAVPDATGAEVTITLNAIDIGSTTDLKVKVLIAGNPVTDRFDQRDLSNGDYFDVQVNIDGGGWTTIGSFCAPSGSNSGYMYLDEDLSGIGGDNAESTTLGATFQDFTFNVVGTGSSLEVRFVIRSDSGEEELAFDNVRVEGNTGPDTDPPVFTSGFPKTDDVKDTRFDVVVNIDEPGTVYFLVKNGGDSAPTTTEVRNGDTLVVEMANSDYSTTVSPVAAASTFDIYFLAEDDEDTPNEQATTTKISETTAALRELALTYPVGGENFFVGDTIDITWTSANIDSVSLFVWSYGEVVWFDVLDSNLLATLASFELPIPRSADLDSLIFKIADSQDTTFNSKSGKFYLTDTIRPVIEELTPMNSSTGAGQGIKLVLALNESVDATTGNIVIKKADGTTVETIDVTGEMVEIDYNEIEITLSDYLEKNSSYYVLVDAGAFEDFQGNTFAGITQNTTWTFTTIGQDLYFSEYIEGGSSRKALEIHNPTDAAVNLDDYRIAQSYNGGGWQYYHYFPTSTMLDANDLWVIITDDTDFDTMTVFIKADADEVLSYSSSNPVVFFTGNDARAIEKTNDGGNTWFIVDVFGHPDSSSTFEVAGITGAAQNHTLWRKDIYNEGNVDWWASAGTNAFDSEWKVMEVDNFKNLAKLTPKSDSLADIKSFVLAEQHSPAVIDSAAATVDIVVILDTKLDSLFPTITISDGAMIEPASGDSVDFSAGSVVFTVTAENQTHTRDWTVSVTEYQIPSSEKKILSFVLDEQSKEAVIDTVNYTVTAEVVMGTPLNNLAPAITVSASATIIPESGVAMDWSTSSVWYTVTAQDLSTQDWEVTITAVTPVEVANLAALRAATADNETIYKVTGEIILTAQMDYRGRKYLQDATGAIEIDDNDLDSVTTVYSIGDGITGLMGTLEDFYGWLEIHPIVDPGAPTSTGNTITPKVVTIADFKANFDDHAAQLIRIDTVDLTETGNFANGDEIDIARAADTTILMVHFYDTDLTGSEIPEKANVTGIAYWHYSKAKITPRFKADVEKVEIIPDKVNDVLSGNMMRVYPNPSSGMFTFELRRDGISDLEVEIVSLNGKLIYRNAYRSVSAVHEQIDLGNVARGMYLLRVRTADEVFVSKLVIR